VSVVGKVCVSDKEPRRSVNLRIHIALFHRYATFILNERAVVTVGAFITAGDKMVINNFEGPSP